ncbi:unnamed protein product [Ceutorhynchus assimilis]|uniref:Uncharacterized protein n=1 Tax=Ceutorhynchus assimilis TaxID=467358 RepID=A0A9N9N172_9CUCU|nr:unnamed protein product [Ceutorhynchus assimilis]
MVENTGTLTCRDGLAYVVGSSAGPTQIIRSYTRYHCSAGSSTTSTQYSVAYSGTTRRRNRRYQKNERLERMETSGSDSDQQFVAEQDGERDQKTIRKRRSLHNPSLAHRRRDGSDRLLAVRQLLVSRSGNGRRDGGLTSAQRSSGTRRTQGPARRRRRSRGRLFSGRGRGKFVTWGPVFQSRERLASCRGIRKRRSQSLTPRPVRKERFRHHG